MLIVQACEMGYAARAMPHRYAPLPSSLLRRRTKIVISEEGLAR